MSIRTDKKKNMAYWDEIEDILLQAVKDVAAMSMSDKKMDEEGDDILGISKEALEIIISRLEETGYEFPFVDENY